MSAQGRTFGRAPRRQVTGGGEGPAERGQRDGSRRQPLAAFPQRDVDGPIIAAGFGELARTVQRVDDPDTLRRQPDRVVDAFLGEHRIGGTFRFQRFHQEVV